MEGPSLEHELIALEERYWQSMKDKDAGAATALTDYPCIVAGASGVMSVDEEAFTRMLEGGAWAIKDFTLGEDVQVRRLTEDVAIIAYKIRENLTVEGEAVTMEASDASVWVRREGKWRCALHTESVIGDPYGRDRKPAH